MKINNFDKLALNDNRKLALKIAEAGLMSIDTQEVLHNLISLEGDELRVDGKKFTLPKNGRIFFGGIGKCALDSARAIEGVLGDKIYKGIAIDIKSDKSLKKIKSASGDHPLPTQNNVELTGELISMLEEATEDDLVILVISGGGSTLLCQPLHFTCEEESTLLQSLMRSGANIQEVNTIRKHLSMARGGHLAKAAHPARVVSIIFSDVIGDDLEFIASGPTIKDTTTVEDAQAIFEKYALAERTHFNESYFMETPKEDEYFEHVDNILAVTNKVALDAMERVAKEAGFATRIATCEMAGEAGLLGESIIENLHDEKPMTIVLYGGESTVRIRGTGRGGRNQELALSALSELKDGEIILTLASDGRDNGDVAGALCDILTRKRTQELELRAHDFLMKNDSQTFFEKVGDAIMTGPTGSNVADFVIAIKFY